MERAFRKRPLLTFLSASIGQIKRDPERPAAPAYGDIFLMNSARGPHDGDIAAVLADGYENTLKTYSRQGDKITLSRIETKHHTPRRFHVSRIIIRGVLPEIMRRSAKRKR
jgi:SOS-response transcriptional repressor LexA